ncbi:MAG TPA: glycosyltransferase family 2 protein [Candidatus Onthousia faecipullorum]|uniref:Glycosyltransferase family 2 protein n=1 Tax=Candidatus Onthousia faecipullorum TaxID=2840887 RepID=A0A9D1KCQ0_9FIRM|nr:glycosyltransferase family 2 protein [Candidatus Onthousia faecipullorum]
MTKVSIIVPVYNSGKYLKTCLDSIVRGTLKDIEIIAIDDCSTDNSLLILEEYAKKDSRIKVYHNEKNLGQGASRNRGLDVARGEYIGFVDSDDYVSCTMYENMYNIAIETNAPLVITYIDYVYDDSFFNKTPTLLEDVFSFNPHDKDRKHVIPYETPSSCTKLYKRELIGNHRFMENTLFEDVEFTYFMMMKAEKITILPAINYYYRVNNYDSLSFRTYKKTDKIYDIFKVLDKLEEDVKSIKRNVFFKEELKRISIKHSLSRIFEIRRWDESIKVREKAIKDFLEIVYEKYGGLQNVNIIELQKSIGHECVDEFLMFLSTKGEVEVKYRYK